MENFNEYMTYFKSLDLKEKQKIVFDQLKMLAVATNGMCKDIKADNEVLLNKEISDLVDGNYSEDDFAEALIVLVNSIQGSITDFNDKMATMLETIN